MKEKYAKHLLSVILIKFSIYAVAVTYSDILAAFFFFLFRKI